MRRRSRTAMVALTTLLALAFALPATSAAAEMGKIRAFHDSPDTPAVDIWVNGAKALTGVTFGTVSPYLVVPQGDYRIEVKVSPSGAGDPAALSRTVTLGSTPKTVAAIGSLAGDGGALRLKVLNDRRGIAGNWALLRVAHTSPDAPAVDVQLRLGRYWVPVIRSLAFGSATGYLPLPANNPFTGSPIKYDFRIVAAGTNTVVKTLDDVVLPKGRALTVWAVGFLTPLSGTPGFGVQITPDGRDAF
jgi:hypothetical protein